MIIFELTGNAVGPVLGTREDDDTLKVFLGEERFEEFELLIVRDGEEGVFDGFVDGLGAADDDASGILEGEFGDLFDLGRNRGGEEQGLAALRAGFGDFFNVADKAHVEHAVDFVEDEHLDVAQVDHLFTNKVHQATDGGDHDVGALAESLALFAITDAAV